MIQIKDVTHSRWKPPLRGNLLIFIAGILVGTSLALLIVTATRKPLQPISYQRLLQMQRTMLENLHGPYHNYEEDDNGPLGEEVEPRLFHDHGQSYSDDLSKKVRVLCWIMTSPKSHQSKAKHIELTWGKRCNTLLFMSSAEDKNLSGVVTLKMDAEDRNHLWQKTKLAFEYVHKHHRDEADWFLKADDDTYVVMENLRYFLSRRNTSKPIFFGHKFKTIVKQGYMSGGAGYVLSREALNRFVDMGLNNCRQGGGGAEDVNMGECLMDLGVEAGNSRDQYGGERFLPLNVESHLTDKLPNWFWTYTAYKQNGGQKSVSDSMISFHYTNPTMMHLVDFLLYHARPYGVTGWYEKEKPTDEPNRPFDKKTH